MRGRTGRRQAYHVIGNGADVDLFKPTSTARIPGSRDYVVFVGALASWQGIETVLDAVKAPEWPSNVDVVIAGDGKERGGVEAAARNNARIRWLGTIPYAEFPP